MQYEWHWHGVSLPSKKNSKRIVANGRRPMILSSEKYLKWEKEFVKDIVSLGYSIGSFDRAIFEIRSPDRRQFDLTNKAESLMDGMVEAKYITDDSVKFCPDIRLRYLGVSAAKEWEVFAIFEKS